MIHELRHVRAFLKVAQTRNLTKAALELHVSQSALTVQIQQLEESLGLMLFDRNKRGVTLTGAGQDVFGSFQRLYDDALAIVNNAQDLSSAKKGSITIATLPTVSAMILPKVLARFGKSHPNIRVLVHDAVAERVREAVLKREADIGIGTLHGKPNELSATPLFRDRLVVFTPADHPLARESSTTLRQAQAHGLILPTRDSSVRENIETMSRKEQVFLEPQYEVNFMPTALLLVRSGLGVAILPESAAGAGGGEFARVSLGKNAAIRSVQLLQRADRSLSPAAKQFVAHLLAFFKEEKLGKSHFR